MNLYLVEVHIYRKEENEDEIENFITVAESCAEAINIVTENEFGCETNDIYKIGVEELDAPNCTMYVKPKTAEKLRLGFCAEDEKEAFTNEK